MKTKIILFFLFVNISLSFAQRLQGLLFESDRRVTIMLNGQAINTPSSSCFIANLNEGNYSVRAFDNNDCVFDQIVNYPGFGVKRVSIGSNSGGNGNYNGFDQLLQALKNASFDDKRLDLLSAANYSNIFTVDQVKTLINQFTFPQNKLAAAKLLFSSCNEKELYFTVADCFAFSSDKQAILEYIKQQKNDNNQPYPSNPI